MAETLTVNVPLNRVEGDLEIRAEINDGICRAAWCSGTMFRGFEQILLGRGPLDGLVITPRICGICSMSHLTAAALALDDLSATAPPNDAVRLRNVAQMVEHLQSDIRQSALMFAADFTNPAYSDQPLYDEALRRYSAFKGESFIEVVRQSKKIIEIVAILAGQWPHSTFMVPGGITSIPSRADLLQCKLLLQGHRKWYESKILGCSLERWGEIESRADLQSWLQERAEHRDSEVGFLLRFGEAIGLDRIGAGTGVYLSYGAFELPPDTKVSDPLSTPRLTPSGVVDHGFFEELAEARVSEHVAHSWFDSYEGGKHPSVGETRPYASGQEGQQYSWAKAPRYDDRPSETGPLAEAMVSRNPLFRDLVGDGGGNALTRQLARLVRSVKLIPAMESWLEEVKGSRSCLYGSPGEIERGSGVGLTQAARGALGHWLRIDEREITHYQIITPTSWNASPRDSKDIPGPIETALVGTPVADIDNPVELGHVVRSFDPCLVCTVHALAPGGKRLSRMKIGVRS